VVDLDRAVLGVPVARRLFRIGNEPLQARVGEMGVPHHRGVHFSVEQHLEQVASLGRALDRGGIPEFRHVRLLERHPAHGVDVDPVIVGEDAAEPHARRHRVGADADAAAIEVLRAQLAARGVVHEERVLEAPEHHRRQQHVGLAVRLRHQVGHDGELGDIELEVAHGALERAGDLRNIGEIESDPRRGQLAAPQRPGGGVVAEERFQPRHAQWFGGCRALWSGCHRGPLLEETGVRRVSRQIPARATGNGC
jgi:hypothetical protein